MDDDEMKMIREARMRELQQQRGQEGDSQSNRDQEAQQRKAQISRIVEPEAQDRLERIRLVNDSRATDVERRLLMLLQSGQLSRQLSQGQKVTEEQLKQLLGSLSEQQEEKKIVVAPKRGQNWDEDDLDDLLKDG